METINEKVNNFCFYKITEEKGIALLFSIMLSAIFLTIALGVSIISVKELNFSSSTKDTNNAFYAADSGVECALYNDKNETSVFVEGGQEITCFNQGPFKLENNFPEFNFNIPLLGNGGLSCAKVTVLKTFTATDPPTLVSTKIISSGYNVGDKNCDSDITSRVERVLEVNY